jgi:hypothetical protein
MGCTALVRSGRVKIILALPAGTRVEKLRTTKGAFACAADDTLPKRRKCRNWSTSPAGFGASLAGNTCPLGNEVRDLRSEVGGQRSDFPVSGFQISAFAFASQLWAEDFTAKLFCNVEFWLERLPKLIGAAKDLSKITWGHGWRGKETV